MKTGLECGIISSNGKLVLKNMPLCTFKVYAFIFSYVKVNLTKPMQFSHGSPQTLTIIFLHPYCRRLHIRRYNYLIINPFTWDLIL